MRFVNKCLLPMLAMILSLGIVARGQVINVVPASSWVVLKFSNLDATSTKVANFCKTMGITQADPDMEHPLDAFLDQIGVKDGINRSGEMALAGLDPTPYHATFDQGVGVLLVPVTDYQAFLGNFKDVKTDGDVSTFTDDKMSPAPTYAAHWGDYAAISALKDVVTQKPSTILKLSDSMTKEWNSRDAIVVLNVGPVRNLAVSQVDQFKQIAADFLDQQANSPAGNQLRAALGIDMAKAVPLLKIAVNQLAVVIDEYIQQTDTLSFGLKVNPDGISTSAVFAFAPDSPFGKLVAENKNTDASLLTGLPEGKYLFFGGGLSNPDVTNKFISHILDPVQKQVADLGPDYASINDFFPLIKSYVMAEQSSSVALVAPTGMLGQEPLMQVISVRGGDAKTLLDDTHKMYDAQQTFMDAVGLKNTSTKQTYTAAARTVDGVTFDDMVTTFNFAAAGPGAGQMRQVMNLVYGPTGMNMYIGAVNDKVLLTEMGLNDAMLSSAIAAAKSSEAPMGKSKAVQSIASQLPPQRMAEFYLPLDVWADSALNIAKNFSMNMGVKIPDDLPPLGFTISTDGPSSRIDGYIPTLTIQALTSAGLQAYMTAKQQQGGPPPGGL